MEDKKSERYEAVYCILKASAFVYKGRDGSCNPDAEAFVGHDPDNPDDLYALQLAVKLKGRRG